jgi:hypothetical protein
MIFMWIAMELLFAFVGMSLFGNVMGAYFCVLGGAAFGGYLGYRNVLNAPDTTEY